MKFKSINFTCKNCGAPLRFSPITNTLLCEFCSSQESIQQSIENIYEYNLQQALQQLDTHHEKEIKKDIKCNKCSATFTMTPYSISSNCPYCNTPAITEFSKEIVPKSILPFQLSQREAQSKFKQWIGSLWFAPSELKKFVQGDRKLKGYYLPHWTYDSQTQTYYQGQRGDIYYVTIERNVVINGRQERRRVQEARIRWTNVSGEVTNVFDDITVGASKTISTAILDNLTPWHTEVLAPFNKKYLAGFDSEEYTIGLDNGFELAKVKMIKIIRKSIKHQIAGDQQQIHQMKINYHHSTYKNVLFPIWTAKFKWKNKIYNYAINGQTGKIIGERPYSIMKIISLVLIVGSIIGGIIYLEENPNILKNITITY